MTFTISVPVVFTTTLIAFAAPMAVAQAADATAELPNSNDALLFANNHSDTTPLPVPQDPDASIDKAKPVEEMLGEEAFNGTTLDVDADSATADSTPCDAEQGYVNTQSDEAEVGIPNSE